MPRTLLVVSLLAAIGVSGNEEFLDIGREYRVTTVRNVRTDVEWASQVNGGCGCTLINITHPDGVRVDTSLWARIPFRGIAIVILAIPLATLVAVTLVRLVRGREGDAEFLGEWPLGLGAEQAEAVVGPVEELVGRTAEPVEGRGVDGPGVDHGRQVALLQRVEVVAADDPATGHLGAEQELTATLAVIGAERAILRDAPPELRCRHQHDLVGIAVGLEPGEERSDPVAHIGKQIRVVDGLIRMGVETADADRDDPGPDAEVDDSGGRLQQP